MYSFIGWNTHSLRDLWQTGRIGICCRESWKYILETISLSSSIIWEFHSISLK